MPAQPSVLEETARKSGIKYFLISFIDLFGVMRAKLVPASSISDMHQNGAGFAGFAAWLDMTPAHPDMFAVPDAASLIQLPWRPEVGWLASDLYMDGKGVAQAPRNTLKRVLAQVEDQGHELRTGVECEYFLISENGTELADGRDVQAKPCYDQSALMRRYDLISEICDAMQQLGWGPYQNDHEDANGQFEMNWDYDHALITADRHAFFKYMVKALAEKHQLRVTFMPKPFPHLTGNGCHAHLSLWKKDDNTNLFLDTTDELGISKLGYHFLGGILHHGPGLCALLNPTVNSYKRLNAPRTSSGATWSPNTITWSGNNRTHMIRIPDAGRMELRLADGAVNPYLLPAALLAAGLDGVAQKKSPGKRLDIDMYEKGHTVRHAKKLPINLLDALRALQRDRKLCSDIGSETTGAFLKLKNEEWLDFTRHLTGWERDHTLDC